HPALAAGLTARTGRLARCPSARSGQAEHSRQEPHMPRERGEKVVATNRRARHDYTIEKTYEAGLVLTGTEVKSLRQGRANLSDGYAYIDGGEAYLDAVHIPEYSQGHWTNHASKRTRKLLLHKDEIIKLSHAVAAGGYTLVPLKLYFLDGRAKVEI